METREFDDESNNLSIQNQTLQVQDFKITLKKSEIDKLESLYRDLLDNSKLDCSLSRYDTHFKALYDSLTSVVKNENDLHDKLIVLKRENTELNLKLNQAIKLSGIDLTVKENLFEKLEKTSVEAAIALSKQKSALKTVNFQKVEILNLLNLSEQNAGLSLRQNYNLNELKKENQQLKIGNENFCEEVNNLKLIIQDLRLKEEQSDKFVQEAKEKLEKSLQEQLKLKLDLNKYFRKNEQLEIDVSAHKTNIETKELELVTLNQTILSSRIELKSAEKTIKDLQSHLENYKKLNDNENVRYQELKSDNDELGRKIFVLMKENRNLINKNELKESSINELELKLAKAQEKRDIVERKSKQIEDQKLEIESQKTMCQVQLESANKKLKLFELDKDHHRKQIVNLINEKEKIYLELEKSKIKKDNSKDIEKTLRIQFKQVESEKLAAIKQIENLQLVVAGFDKERNDFVSNLNDAMLKNNNLNTQVKTQEIDLERNKNTLKSYCSKFEEIQQTLNVSRRELNFKHKNYGLIKEELRETKLNLEKCAVLEINAKKVLNKKEAELIRSNNENEKLENFIGQLKKNVNEKDMIINDYKNKLNSFETSENKLLKITKETEKELKSYKKIILKSKNDISMLVQSLIVRNHQVGFLYEQLEFMRKTLKEGEVCFEKKVSQINSFKIELNNVRKENEILRRQKTLIKCLKEELDSKRHDLMIEKAKTDANDKLHKSLNIHRWRKLKGCDPTTYLLILKINQLQKRLITKSEQVAELQLKFIEKDQLFLQLKQCTMNRLLTEETSNILEDKKQIILRQSRQLKAALAENIMLEEKNAEQKQKIVELQNGCDEFKKKYFLSKSSHFHKDK